ncbi:MAG: hypothetical protein LBI54_04430 [Lachnospiraceae bacterium]|jgi:hypothetical protein|nr:hypothetical protein [Lachnospiraceae bacterium]
MTTNTLTNKTYKQIESFRKATGITAVLAAIISLSIAVLSVLQYNLTEQGIIWGIISQFAGIIAMILVALYAFAIYGKRQSRLFAVSAIILMGQGVLSIRSTIDIIRLDSVYNVYFSEIRNYVSLVSDIIIVLIFLLIALKHFEKLNINIKALPIIAIIAVLLQSFSIFFIDDDFYNEFKVSLFIALFVSSLFTEVLHIVPFALFIIFCPPNHKRMQTSFPTSPLQEQEASMQDINSQLLYLKTQFENGKISQQEYDYKRKSLVDKL